MKKRRGNERPAVGRLIDHRDVEAFTPGGDDEVTVLEHGIAGVLGRREPRATIAEQAMAGLRID